LLRDRSREAIGRIDVLGNASDAQFSKALSTQEEQAMSTLAQEYDALLTEMRAQLEALAFDKALWLRLASTVDENADKRNRLTAGVTVPRQEDLIELPEPSSLEGARLHEIGMEALRKGQLAVIVLAGGMATRMGGVVKALVPAVENKTFLDLRLAEVAHFGQLSGTPVPLWLMTSYATDGKLRTALGSHLDNRTVATFVQNVSLRLSTDGHVFFEEDGSPSVYAPGHGDLPEAVRRSGLLRQFVEQGGKYVTIANIDNLGATVDPVVLGAHIDHGSPVTVEVVDKVGTDKGGIPVRYNERRMILEEFRLPLSFDPTSVRVFNTNTFVVSAKALDELQMQFTWVQVLKSVGNAKAVQFERLIGEVTAELDTRFLHVPRDGVRSRFLPVKDMQELEHRRSEILAVARNRGMLP
jgi:UTP--glucose-1-phosphate uridylyltransferase